MSCYEKVASWARFQTLHKEVSSNNKCIYTLYIPMIADMFLLQICLRLSKHSATWTCSTLCPSPIFIEPPVTHNNMSYLLLSYQITFYTFSNVYFVHIQRSTKIKSRPILILLSSLQTGEEHCTLHAVYVLYCI